MTPTPAKKATAKKASTTTKRAAPSVPAAATPKAPTGPRVGQLVEYSYDDVPTSSTVTVRGVVVEITDDGAYVAPLDSAAVVPVDLLRAL